MTLAFGLLSLHPNCNQQSADEGDQCEHCVFNCRRQLLESPKRARNREQPVGQLSYFCNYFLSATLALHLITCNSRTAVPTICGHCASCFLIVRAILSPFSSSSELSDDPQQARTGRGRPGHSQVVEYYVRHRCWQRCPRRRLIASLADLAHLAPSQV